MDRAELVAVVPSPADFVAQVGTAGVPLAGIGGDPRGGGWCWLAPGVRPRLVGCGIGRPLWGAERELADAAGVRAADSTAWLDARGCRSGDSAQHDPR